MTVTTAFATIEEAIEDIRGGRMVVVVDHHDHATLADVLDRCLDRRERCRHAHPARLPSDELLDVLREHVRLEVHACAQLEPAEGRHLERVRDQRDREARVVARSDEV